MSDDEPTITVTRGTRSEQSKRKRSSSTDRSQSSGFGLPGPGAVISGAVRGVRTAWWAGLGLVAAARDSGTQVFEALVEEGKSWEQAQRERREQVARQVQQRAEEDDDVVETIEERVRDEVNNALQRVGRPHRDEVDTLREQVDALSEKVERLKTLADGNGD